MHKIPAPIDLVLLLQDLEFGGTQRYAIHLLQHLDRRVFAPQLWVLRGGPDMAALAENAGVRPIWLSQSRRVWPQALARLAWRLLSHRPHILYTLTPVPDIWGRLFGAVAGVPVTISSRRNLRPKQYERLMWRLSTRIICNAGIVKEQVVRSRGVDPRRIVYISNAVDADFFVPVDEPKAENPTVLYVGRLVPDKGPLVLLEGFRLVRRQIPNARLVIVGNGHLKKRLERFIQSNGLASSVELLPGRRDPRPHLRRAWVFAMASVREASPNAILEAMATGLPVVAPAVGGIPELVRSGVTGLIFESGNPSALADALTSLLEDRGLRQSMGRAGREAVLKDFTMKRMLDATERVLIEAVAEACRHRSGS